MKTISILSVIFLSLSALAAPLGKTIEYGDQSKFEGYLVQPKKGPAKGALLMIHNWMGVTDEAKAQADRLAEAGYIVFAADIYGKGIRPQKMEEAAKISGEYKGNRPLFRERLNLAYNRLLQEKNVNKSKIAAVGYCFGGTGALELARSGAPLQAVVSFHGGLDSPTPKDGANIKARVLALHGADDPFVPDNDVMAFEREMREGKVDWLLVKYGGAVHSFTQKSAGNDNSKGQAYNEAADKRSFTAMKSFLQESM